MVATQAMLVRGFFFGLYYLFIFYHIKMDSWFSCYFFVAENNCDSL